MKHSNISIFIPHIGCPNRCSFCNQNSISSTLNIPSIESIRKTLSKALHEFKGDLSNSQIAFFGGSFTAIERDYMISLLEVANEYIGKDMFSSIRISTRPDYINDEILEILDYYNVKSIELGAQSMNDKTLLMNRRGHTSKDIVDASVSILSKGFELGLQMMVGLYGDTEETILDTAEKFVLLKPNTVRIYPTLVLKNTHLETLYTNKKYIPMGLDETISICSELIGIFQRNNIKVIKLGLHESQTVKEDFLAGPYHPAFRELCESNIFIKSLFEKLKIYEKGKYIIYVNPRFVSKAVGQNRKNIFFLEQRGYSVNFSEKEDVEVGMFEITKGD